MATFSFKVEVVSKITPKKSKYKLITKTTTVHTNVTGVVHIKLTGQYCVNTEHGEFPIHPDSFDTKELKIIYPKKLLDGRRYYIIRDEYYGLPSVKNALPFAPGCLVSGSVTHSTILKVNFFKICKIWEDTEGTNEECKAASTFYRNNYDLIFKK